MFQVAEAGSEKEAAGDRESKTRDKTQPAARQESHYALLEFEKPVTCLPDSIAIGSRLDTDVHIHLILTTSYIYHTAPLYKCWISAFATVDHQVYMQ